MSSRIISVDHNTPVFQVRNILMRSAGYAVLDVHLKAEPLKVFSQLKFALAILGSAMSEEERLHMASAMKRLSPSTPILAVIPSFESWGEADIGIDSLGDPKGFLQQIAAMMMNRTRAPLSESSGSAPKTAHLVIVQRIGDLPIIGKCSSCSETFASDSRRKTKEEHESTLDGMFSAHFAIMHGIGIGSKHGIGIKSNGSDERASAHSNREWLRHPPRGY